MADATELAESLYGRTITALAAHPYRDHPIVAAHLMALRQGQFSREEALIGMVRLLCEENQALKTYAETLSQTTPYPPFTVPKNQL